MKRIGFLLLLVGLTTQVHAGPLVARFQHEWAIANYQLEGDEQEARFENLVNEIDEAVAKHPDDPELLIWQGIIKSTWAGKTGGLSALGIVKDARNSLEKAMTLDDKAMNGSAYTSLGALYYQVPGWPLAFGSDKKARKLLEKAIEMNPDGIDSNYFYGDFLFRNDEYEQAKARLEKALNAPGRPGREIADAGRRKEINDLLSRVQEHLDS